MSSFLRYIQQCVPENAPKTHPYKIGCTMPQICRTAATPRAFLPAAVFLRALGCEDRLFFFFEPFEL